MPRVSVVVPIYNVEDYLTECLDSLAAQTFEDIEVVMVDDGATDRSGEIAAAFALTPATISEHLGVLRRAGLVEMTKVGTSRRYRANPTALAGLHGALEDAGKWRPADALPEQDLTFRGRVTAIDRGQVTLEVWEEAPDGRVLMPGRAVVELPVHPR